MSEIYVLGATGRIGRAVAIEVARQNRSPVLVGRDSRRLEEFASTLGGAARTLVLGSIDEIAAEIGVSRPAVVFNTIGPFTETAVPIARACLSGGSHYADLANERAAVADILALQGDADAAGCALVTGAGFGVLGTESVVLKLCAGQPTAARVRVDALGAVGDHGPVGEAVASSVIDGLTAGSRRYQDGRLVRSRFGADREILHLPDGSEVSTGGAGSGELEAARRASAAASVIAASSMVPTSGPARAMMPVMSGLLTAVAPLRNAAKRRLAASHPKPEMPQGGAPVSWAHARVEWPEGKVREGWLRLGDAMDFTAAVAVEVTLRLAAGEGRPGAYTPGALFGPDLAVAAGGEFVLDQSAG